MYSVFLGHGECRCLGINALRFQGPRRIFEPQSHRSRIIQKGRVFAAEVVREIYARLKHLRSTWASYMLGTSLRHSFCMTSITGPSCKEDTRLGHCLQIVFRTIYKRCGCGFRGAHPFLYDVKLLQLSRVLVTHVWRFVQTSPIFFYFFLPQKTLGRLRDVNFWESN